MENAQLQRAIIDTLSFFTLFEYPLTIYELTSWLKSSEHVNQGKVYSEALQFAKQKRSPISFKNGFFFLSGHELSVERRMQLFLTHLPKFNRARRAAKILSYVPFLRMVAICNTVAMATSNPQSDIDFFIVARARRLYFVRIWTTFLLQISGLRRHGSKIANRVCLSFYVTDNALDVSSMRLQNGDIYLTYWPTQLVLLFDEENTYNLFVKANQWVRALVPSVDFESALSDLRRIKSGRTADLARKILESFLDGRLGDFIEYIVRIMQQIKMTTRHSRARPVSSAVVVSDTVLKFHEQDRRQEFNNRWQEIVSAHTVNYEISLK